MKKIDNHFQLTHHGFIKEIIPLVIVVAVFLLLVAISLPQFASMSSDSRSHQQYYHPQNRSLSPVNAKPYADTYFKEYGVNPFIATEDDQLSTFGLDVDTASWSICSNYLKNGNIPDSNMIRVEEFVNSFSQDYPVNYEPLSIYIDGAKSHYGGPNYHLVRIGVKTSDKAKQTRNPANLVFVVDTSSSMNGEQRIETVKKSLKLLVSSALPQDRFALVSFGNSAEIKCHLGASHSEFLEKVNQLQTNGSTNVESGLLLGYKIAREYFNKEHINRVVLCSDGVANLDSTGSDSILKKIKKDANAGIFLTCLGYGMGNYNDILMEQLANHGDGNYHYINSMQDAIRLFNKHATELLAVALSDARVQVEFNQKNVDRFRLIGYENREMKHEDFTNMTKDAGELGLGHTVTALYEIRVKDNTEIDATIALVKARGNNPQENTLVETEKEIRFEHINHPFQQSSSRFQLTASVAAFAEILKNSKWTRKITLQNIIETAENAINNLKPTSRDLEFVEMVKIAKKLNKKTGSNL